jgi:cytochrome c553
MHKSVVAFLYIAVAACNRGPAPITFDGALTSDKAAQIDHGERLTHVLGCKGCHTPRLTGQNLTAKQPQAAPFYSSNLTLAFPAYSDGALERLLRTGVHPVRKDLWVMPSEVFQNLSAADMKALIAYLRTVPPAGKPQPVPAFNAISRKQIAEGTFKPAAELVTEYRQAKPVDLGPGYALGRYITTVTCAECHGPALKGDPTAWDTPPDLVAAAGYSRAEFDRLITQGMPTGYRRLKPRMVNAARNRLSHLTPHERDALYAYLKARAERS